MEAAVIAHEAGHISLSHTLGVASNFDVARNQERERTASHRWSFRPAPFASICFWGRFYNTSVFMDRSCRPVHEPDPHPLGRERFFNVLINNSAAAGEAADQFGLTRERLIALLPPEDAQAVTMRFLQSPGTR